MKLTRWFLFAALAVSIPTATDAQNTMPGSGKITLLAGGWTNADLRIQLNTTFYNPDNCSYTDGYVVANTTPGYQLLDSILITAYSRGDSVNLVVQGCYVERPNIIGVTVQPAGS